jgi:glycosyltransferase involved in cell wall biosynthesis
LGDQVRVVFHEPFVQFGWRHPLRNLLAAANRLMARDLLSAARRSYVSVPAWADLLRPWAPAGVAPLTWLPVGSTIPVHADAAATAAIRDEVTGGRPERPVLGHFGTYGSAIAELVRPALIGALHAVPDAVALLVGRGAERFAEELASVNPTLRGRLHASHAAGAEEVSHAIGAFDVALQPYPDGATSRRTTLMAALAHGVAVATHLGRFSEPLWREAGFPVAAEASAVEALAIELLRDPARSAASASEAVELYRSRFSAGVALGILLDEPHA